MEERGGGGGGEAGSPCSQDAALLLPSLALFDLLQRLAGGRLEHLAHAFLGLGRALHVGSCPDALGHGAALLHLHGGLLHPLQLLTRGRVVPQVLLVPDQDDGHVGAEMAHLGVPLLRDVLQAVRAVHGEAHQDDVGVRVGQGPQAVVVLLAGRVPQS